MTNREQKKQMTRAERKDYKAKQRENLKNFYVFVTRVTPKNPKNVYTKLVSRNKADEMVNGKIVDYSEVDGIYYPIRKQQLKHKFEMREINA